MPIPNFSQVHPGDLITADLMNGLIDAIKNLQTRVSDLESATGANSVTITNITGVTSPIRVNTRVTATGTNFATPATLNTLTIDGTPVTNLSTIESSPTKLVFDAPNVTGLPESGKLVTLQVTNALGTGSRQFVLAPVLQVATGNIQVVYTAAPVLQVGQNISLGQSYIFTFRVTAFATLGGNYRVQPSITGASGWSAQVLQESGDTPGSGIFNIPGTPSGASKDVRIRVTLGPAGGAGTLNVNVVTEQESQVLPGNVGITITPGQPAPSPETRVRISLATPAPVNGRVPFTRNQVGAIGFLVAVTQAGNYTVAAQMRNTTGWTPNGIDIPSFTVNTPPPPGSTANQNVTVAFTPGSAATNTDVVFTVTRGSDISVQYSLPVSVS